MTRARTSTSRLWAIVAIVFGALAWTAPPAGGQTVPCAVSTGDESVDVEEQNLLRLVNDYRRANGRNALAMDPSVTRAASWFSRDMATKNYFPYDHVDSNGRTIPQRLTWCGVSYSNWAENIYAGSPDAQSVFNAWKASSSHNTNMLRDGITAAGIARAYSPGTTYGWYWTLDLTNTAAGTTTTTAPPVATTTTTRPTGPAPGSPEWYALYYPQYFGATTTTRPTTTSTTAPHSTTTTTTRLSATTTTTRPPTTTVTTSPTAGPAPGTPEWWLQYYPQYFGR